jgi:hypothetical protein
MARPGIDNVQSVQSEWVGPYTFSYKAEVDFDGTYLAAKLMARYEDEFLGSPNLKEDLQVGAGVIIIIVIVIIIIIKKHRLVQGGGGL